MFDYKNMSFNGVEVAYATLPMYMLNAAVLDGRLTASEKLVFIRLMAYASAVNSCSFGITNAWVEKNTGLSKKTVSRALASLLDHGYLDGKGIVYAAPPTEAKRTAVKDCFTVERKQPPRPQPSVQVDIFGYDTEIAEQKTETITDIAGELNDILRSLGSVKKVKSTGQIVQKSGQNSQIDGQNSPPYITIPNNNQKLNTPTESAEKPAAKKQTEQSEKSGVLFSTPSKGFVEKSKPKPLASFLPTAGLAKGQTVSVGKMAAKLSSQHTSYIATALQRMNVTSQSERQRYTDEIAYAATQGAFSETYTHTPLKAIRACLNLVEAGKWRANAGMY